MIKINLLPTVEEFVQVPIQIYAALLGMGLGVVALGGWWWMLDGERSTAREQVSGLEAESQRLQAIQTQIQEFEQRKKNVEDRIAAIEQLLRNQKGPVELMNVVIASVPSEPGLWLSSLVQQENIITLEGRAFSVPFIADFIAALNNTPPFRFVELQYWEQDPDDTIRFRLHCELEEDQPEEQAP